MADGPVPRAQAVAARREQLTGARRALSFPPKPGYRSRRVKHPLRRKNWNKRLLPVVGVAAALFWVADPSPPGWVIGGLLLGAGLWLRGWGALPPVPEPPDFLLDQRRWSPLETHREKIDGDTWADKLRDYVAAHAARAEAVEERERE